MDVVDFEVDSSLNWIPLSKTEASIVVVNFLYLSKLDISKFVAVLGFKLTSFSTLRAGNYTRSILNLEKQEGCSVTENDVSVITSRIKDTEMWKRRENGTSLARLAI